jgi:methyl-accepting chemotaxis protein
MNIRQKLLLGAGTLTLLPVAITAYFLWQNANSVTKSAVGELSQAQLVSLRDAKRAQVQDEINNRVRDVQSLAAQRSTVEAMRGFKVAYSVAAKESPKFDVSASRERLFDFVKTQFAPEFAKRNAAALADPTALAALADPNALSLQNDFILNNPNPLGQKEKLVTPANDTTYGRVHAQYHPSLERVQKLAEFYDIFLIDTENDSVVYTVFKELDFASSLATGIASKSKLREAYEKVKAAKNRDSVFLSDFATYAPSYDDQAAFIAAPIYDQDKQIGVIAVQYPIDKITEVMSSNKEWKKIGLGDSGDVFIVGPDKKMRTNARYMTSNKEGFLQSIANAVTPQEKAQLLKKDTTVGLVKVDTDEVREALQGKEGYFTYTDYRGVPSYAAAAPIKVQGLNWSIVAKIDQDESDAPVDALSRSFLTRALAVALGVIVLAGLIMSGVIRKFLEPIQKLSQTVQSVASGDNAARSKLTATDEIGSLGRSFDALLDDRLSQYEKAQAENETLNNSVISLLQTVFQLSNRDLTVRAPVTEDVVGTVSSSINQFADETGRTLQEVKTIADRVQLLSASVSSQAALVNTSAQTDQQFLKSMSENLGSVTNQMTQVARLSEQTNQAAVRATGATNAALSAVDGTVKGMDRLRETMSEMEKRFKRLGERSQEISSAIALINTISERTHVLAVNASMQAATAGEAGRGFAVVASEVQRLSDNSRQATATIAQLVTNIQADTNETLVTVNRLIAEVVQQTQMARQAGTQMAETQTTTQQLVGLVREIAGFSQTQAKLAVSLQQSVTSLNEGASRTSAAISNQTTSTQTLASVASRLAESVGQFKLDPVAT